MSSLTNINNNSSVINVGRTTPVSPGAKPANESIPVVVASDQAPIPVIEQQKIQSEVALSLLGIPRGEVALGIFSDVNTYDVNPSEWSEFPTEYTPGWGVKHLPQEAGAMVQAPKDKLAILSSKRFFRYQPGRVSSATFGVKSSQSPSPILTEGSEQFDLNPAIRKYGIFDKYDGYYWETRSDSTEDNFAVVRRTQALLNLNPVEFSDSTTNQDDYRIAGKAASDPAPETNIEPRAIELVKDQLFDIVDDAYTAALASFTVGTESYNHLLDNRDKCERDVIFAINSYILDFQYSGTGHTITNATTYRTAIGPTATQTTTTNARRTAENQLHEEIGIALIAALSSIATLNGSLTATRINELVTIIRTAVGDGNTLGVQPSTVVLTSTSSAIWPRNKFKTISSVYKRYLGYLISVAFIPEADYTDALKYKCLRDVGYIVDGYMRDLAGGGNTATVYNMKNFYFNNVLQVYSTFASGYSVVQFHIDAHTILKTLISKDGDFASGNNPNTSRWDTANLVGFTSVFNYFGLSETARTRFNNDLADPVIANFTTAYSGRMDLGTEAQFGDMVTLRDGLIHIHAGVYDPSLLKETKQVRVRVDAANNTLEAVEGDFAVGQTINFIGDAGGLTSDKFYAVKSVSGSLGNIINLYDILDETKAEIDITSVGTDNVIEPNVPFIFPSVYQKGNELAGLTFTYPSGMFPYMYTEDGNLPRGDENVNFVGFIDTAIDTATPDYEILRSQIDDVNYRYNNWVKQNVDPRYYAVYEYRVPRSRYSTEKLDGQDRKIVYSDVATGETSEGIRKVRPGQNVVSDGATVNRTSVWDIDLTKVTMLKVEFSWYGAVGALFLAYVPVSNDEARWVRVHNLRASNQLKISSLGNATLPITYVTYGGGSVNKLGIEDNTDKSYGETSDHIVKYGASYYIDGGDRGTVRLYSHANLSPTEVYGRTFTLGTVSKATDAIGTYITTTEGPTDKTYFMKAQLTTSSIQDQNIQVIWVDGNKLYLNKDIASTASVKLVTKRPAISFGLKAKEAIFNSKGTGIRNRVQVYPTKLSTANFATVPVTLDILKSPIFQPNISVSGTFTLSDSYVITPSGAELPTTDTTYLASDGDEIYGWFIANVGTVFGRLYRQAGQYFFDLRDVFTQEVRLFSGIPFLKDGRFAFDGTTVSDEYEGISQKERLSSVFISNVNQSPIPETGSIITSFFLSPGTEQFDLLSYFDYNKDYLSYPLTDEVESIYLAEYLSGENTTSNQINTSITWEEQ